MWPIRGLAGGDSAPGAFADSIDCFSSAPSGAFAALRAHWRRAHTAKRRSAVLNPKALAMAEFSVGRGCLLGSLAATVRAKGEPALPLHADQAMFPAPFPEHNMMLTACWVLDDFTEAGGATRVLPGTNRLRRLPDDAESANAGGVPMACRPGSLAIWDGRVWHGNFARTAEGQRVVLHATYYRLLMRPGEDYSDVADGLIETYGERMSQLLGREDFLFKKHFDYVKGYEVFARTLNNARS